MSPSKTCSLIALAAVAAVSAIGEASAIDRSVTSTRKVKVTSAAVDDSLSLAARPALFAGKPVTLFCERLRNPEGSSMSCRASGMSIVVDIRLLGGDMLRHAHDSCRGMSSACSGIVSGVAEFRNGAIFITDADIDFLEN